jgi:trans-4-hydroxy-L-proline dehydratase
MGLQALINGDTVHEYAPVGCLENTMVGNDRSGTVDNNINLLKAVELALTGGKDMLAFVNPVTGKTEKIRQDGPATGDARAFRDFEAFWRPTRQQTAHIVRRCVDLYEAVRIDPGPLFPDPLPLLPDPGLRRKRRSMSPRAAPQISCTTMEAVTFATTVDSLLAVKYLVYDKKVCSMGELITALRANWAGHEKLRATGAQQGPEIRPRRR